MSDATQQIEFDPREQACLTQIADVFKDLLEVGKKHGVCLHMQAFIWGKDNITTTGDYSACLFDEGDLMASVISLIESAIENINRQNLNDNMQRSLFILERLKASFNESIEIINAQDEQERSRIQ